MIQVSAHLDAGRFALLVEGHEGHVEGGVVCAAVSAITQTALLGLEQVAAQYPGSVAVTVVQEGQK